MNIQIRILMSESNSENTEHIDEVNLSSGTKIKSSKWINNSGDEVKDVFGFNSSAELVNGRAAMVGFLMLILTEIVFQGRPVTSAIFGIN